MQRHHQTPVQIRFRCLSSGPVAVDAVFASFRRNVSGQRNIDSADRFRRMSDQRFGHDVAHVADFLLRDRGQRRLFQQPPSAAVDAGIEPGVARPRVFLSFEGKESAGKERADARAEGGAHSGDHHGIVRRLLASFLHPRVGRTVLRQELPDSRPPRQRHRMVGIFQQPP